MATHPLGYTARMDEPDEPPEVDEFHEPLSAWEIALYLAVCAAPRAWAVHRGLR
jgi:hypothetical protein